jgi:hypothetical protein
MPRILEAPTERGRNTRPIRDIEQSYAFESEFNVQSDGSHSESDDGPKEVSAEQPLRKVRAQEISILRSPSAIPQNSDVAKRDPYTFEDNDSEPHDTALNFSNEDNDAELRDDNSVQDSVESGGFRRRRKKSKALPKAKAAVRAVTLLARSEQSKAPASRPKPAPAVIVIDDDEDDEVDATPSGVAIAARAAALTYARREERKRRAAAIVGTEADHSAESRGTARELLSSMSSAPPSLPVMALRYGRSAHVRPGLGASVLMIDAVSALGTALDSDALLRLSEDHTQLIVVSTEPQAGFGIGLMNTTSPCDLVAEFGADSVLAWDLNVLRSVLAKDSTKSVECAPSMNCAESSHCYATASFATASARGRHGTAASTSAGSDLHHGASSAGGARSWMTVVARNPAIVTVPCFLDVVDIICEMLPITLRRQRSVSITPSSGEDCELDYAPIEQRSERSMVLHSAAAAPATGSVRERRVTYRFALHAADTTMGTLFFVRHGGSDVVLRSAFANARLAAAQQAEDRILRHVSAAAAVSLPHHVVPALKRRRNIVGEDVNTVARSSLVRKKTLVRGDGGDSENLAAATSKPRRKAAASRKPKMLPKAGRQDISILNDSVSSPAIDPALASDPSRPHVASTSSSMGRIISLPVVPRKTAEPDADGWFGR